MSHPPAPPVPASAVPTRRSPWLRRQRAADVVSWSGAVAVGTAIGLWTLGLTADSWTSTSAVLIALSELTGLVGVVLLLLAVVLMARIPALERVVGLDRVTAWHRTLAPYGLYLVTAHVVLAIVGYSGLDGRGILEQMLQFITGWHDMLFAYAGYLLMIAAGISSYRLARKRLKFETWWVVHLYTYLAIVISLFHQLSSGATFAGRPVLQGLWIAAHVGVLAAVVVWRVALPLLRSSRHALRVEAVYREAEGTISLVLTGRGLAGLDLAGGQFFHLRIGRRGMWWQAHPYSVSGLPEGDRIRFTIADSGDYAQQIAETRPGTRVFVEGPYGAFTAASAEPGRRLLLVAGGVGITPVRTLLDDLPAGSRPVVVYRVSEPGEVLFRGELEALVASRGGILHILAGSRHQFPMDATRLRELVPDLREREVFVCGSGPLVDAVRAAVAANGVPLERFHAEEFAW